MVKKDGQYGIWSKKMAITGKSHSHQKILVIRVYRYQYFVAPSKVIWKPPKVLESSHHIHPPDAYPRSSDILQGLYCLHGILGRISGHRLRCHHGGQPWSWNRLWKEKKHFSFILFHEDDWESHSTIKVTWESTTNQSSYLRFDANKWNVARLRD